MARKGTYSRWASISTAGHLHASSGRNAAQSRSQGKIRSAHSCRQIRESRPYSDHEKTHRNGERAPARRPQMVGTQALTKTDTHLVNSGVTNRTICAPLASVTTPIDNLPEDLES